MSRYSSNFARWLGFGSSVRKPRAPASISPWTVTPPSVDWARAGWTVIRAATIASNAPAAGASLMAVSLAREELSGRVVGAVDVRVTVHARPAHLEPQRRRDTAPVGKRAVRPEHVTLLTQARLRDIQNLLV